MKDWAVGEGRGSGMEVLGQGLDVRREGFGPEMGGPKWGRGQNASPWMGGGLDQVTGWGRMDIPRARRSLEMGCEYVGKRQR